MIQYEDFSLHIEPRRGDAYPVSVRSPAGQGRSSFELPFEPDEMSNILLDLARTVRASGGQRHLRDTSRAATHLQPRQVGAQLFHALFSGEARNLYEYSLGRVEKQPNRGLRIKLHFVLDQPHPDLLQLASLPWEYLYKAETRDFLNLNRRTPIVRYLDVPRPIDSPPLRLPLRILVVVSSPTGVEPLDLKKERQNIEAAWGQDESVEVVFLEEATKPALRQALLTNPFHVLHYMGHGGFDERTGRGGLLFEDSQGNPDALTGETLEVILQGASELRLVLLNACDTAQITRTRGQDPFAGVATALVMGGVLAVVAMQFPISDRAALAFSEAFYSRLVAGDPVDAAVAEGRLAIYLADDDTMEWGTPVLFMRAPDGVIWKEVPEDKDERVGPPGNEDAAQTRKENTGGKVYFENSDVDFGGDLVVGDKTVHGDEVRGDKVGGDKIETHVGNVSGSQVAIGEHIQQYFGPTPEQLKSLLADIAGRMHSDPEVYRVVADARARLKTAREQITRVGEYKDTHDDLQQLEMLYDIMHGYMYEYGERLASERVDWRFLATNCWALQMALSDLRSQVRSTSFAADMAASLDEMKTADENLTTAIDKKDTELLEEAIWTIFDMISLETPRLNERLIESVDNLRLADLAATLNEVCHNLTASRADPDGTAGNGLDDCTQPSEKVAEMADLLTRLRNEHDRYQLIDTTFRSEQDQLGHSLARFKRRWNGRLRGELDTVSMCEEEDKLRGLSATVARLDGALNDENALRVMEAFNDCRKQILMCFSIVDSDLKALCDVLRNFGGPLDSMLDKLDESV